MTGHVLGVDIGGVIIDRVNDSTDTSFFGPNYLKTTAVPGAFEVIRKLAYIRFKKIFLVSKCGKQVEEKTLHWLDYHNFYSRAALPRGNVRFCRERHEKAPICKELGITHFVDDRLEVLSHLNTVENRFLFRANEKEVRKFKQHLDGVIRVDSWDEVLAKII